MALKKQITKAEFDNLPEAFRGEYKAQGENFVLDIEGEDGTDWKAKRDIEVEHRKRAEAKVAKTQEELDEMRRGAIPKNDVDALENSWKTKVSEAETRHKAELEARDLVIANSTVTATAKEVASIFMAPAAMLPMIAQRLKSEITNGHAITRVLDKNGQPSAMTVEDLKKEFMATPELAPVIVASKASGSGADGGKPAGGQGGKKFSEMGDVERTALFKSDPAEFHRQVAAQKNS